MIQILILYNTVRIFLISRCSYFRGFFHKLNEIWKKQENIFALFILLVVKTLTSGLTELLANWNYYFKEMFKALFLLFHITKLLIVIQHCVSLFLTINFSSAWLWFEGPVRMVSEIDWTNQCIHIHKKEQLLNAEFWEVRPSFCIDKLVLVYIMPRQVIQVLTDSNCHYFKLQYICLQ